MNEQKQGRGLSLRTAFRIGTHGMLSRPIRLAVVIFLAMAALAMFGLAITGALYDEKTAVVHSIYEYDSGTVFLRVDEYNEALPITQEDLDSFEASTGKTYALIADGAYLNQWTRFMPYITYIDPNDANGCMQTDPQSICYTTQEVLTDAGFTLTGRLPQSKYEIAINGCMLESILLRGYYDHITSPQSTDMATGNVIYEEDCWHIVQSAQELVALGARMLIYDPVTWEEEEAIIVGVVEYGECPTLHAPMQEELFLGLYDQLFVSEEFFFSAVEENYGSEAIGLAAVAGRATSLSQASAVYELNKQEGYALYSESVQTIEEYRGTIASCSATCAGIGAAFAVFAVLLIFQFVSMTIDGKKMQIGILRALGAHSSDVYKIFLSESLFLAVVYAVLAIPLTFGLSKAANVILLKCFSISVAAFNFHWLVPILIFMLSIGITLASVIVPVYRAARKSPVECIRAAN